MIDIDHLDMKSPQQFMKKKKSGYLHHLDGEGGNGEVIRRDSLRFSIIPTEINEYETNRDAADF